MPLAVHSDRPRPMPATSVRPLLVPPKSRVKSSALRQVDAMRCSRRPVPADPCREHKSGVRRPSRASSPPQPAPQTHYRALRTERGLRESISPRARWWRSRVTHVSRRVGLGRRIRAQTAEPAYPSRIRHSESPTHGHSTPVRMCSVPPKPIVRTCNLVST
ncbi:hypothetical protein C8R43DRAFT_1004693 [Mycena crocata]|nr:hypothetical protein C8R43DRAFT_1004693 [Mycena crocata]